MGLDVVELVMEVEETFNIKIPDANVPQILTVGALHRYVVRQLQDKHASHSAGCVSRRAFYALRRAMIEELGIPRDQVRPKGDLLPLIPSWRRRRQWRALSKRLELRMPPLQRPAFVTASCFLLLVPAAFLIVFATPMANLGTASLTLLAALIVVGIVLYWGTLPLATATECHTVGSLVRQIVHLNYGRLLGENAPISDAEVWAILKQMMVRQLGVDPSLVTPEAHIVKDLGAD